YMGKEIEPGEQRIRSTGQTAYAMAFATYDDANYFKFLQSNLKIWMNERYVEVVEISNEVEPLERIPYGLASGGREPKPTKPAPAMPTCKPSKPSFGSEAWLVQTLVEFALRVVR